MTLFPRVDTRGLVGRAKPGHGEKRGATHSKTALPRLGCFRRRAEELPNLLHGVVDLSVERHFAELDARAAPIAGDAVVDTRRVGLWLSRLRNRISEGRPDQVFAHPFIAAEIHHDRGVGNAGMRAARITVGDEP